MTNISVINISECIDIQRYLHYLSDDDMFKFNRLLSSKELRDFCKKHISFKGNLAEISDLARCCLSFLEVIKILLNLIYATCSGNWHWYVDSVKSALPCFLFRIELTIADI